MYFFNFALSASLSPTNFAAISTPIFLLYKLVNKRLAQFKIVTQRFFPKIKIKSQGKYAKVIQDAWQNLLTQTQSQIQFKTAIRITTQSRSLRGVRPTDQVFTFIIHTQTKSRILGAMVHG
jgi:hypothetical protein